MGFQTAFRPRPVFNERPSMPVVPIERVRPSSTSPAGNAMQIAERIKREVAVQWCVPVEDIEGRSRNPDVVAARMEAYRRIFCALPGWNVTQIGKAMRKSFTATKSALASMRLRRS